MNSITISLSAAANVLEGMVYVAGGPSKMLPLAMLHHHLFPAKDLESFYIDRYEVTNREFIDFVDDGGYFSERVLHRPRRLPNADGIRLRAS